MSLPSLLEIPNGKVLLTLNTVRRKSKYPEFNRTLIAFSHKLYQPKFSEMKICSVNQTHQGKLIFNIQVFLDNIESSQFPELLAE